MRKLFAVLMTVAFLGSTGLVFAQAPGAAGQATPVVKSGKVCDKSKKECKGKKGLKGKKECKGKKVCSKDKKGVATPTAAGK